MTNNCKEIYKVYFQLIKRGKKKRTLFSQITCLEPVWCTMALIIDKEGKKRLKRTNKKDCDAALKKLRTLCKKQYTV